MTLAKKKKTLKDCIIDLKKVVVAYSGGVDSSLLLKVSLDVLGSKNVLALIASSSTYPAREKSDAVGFCKSIGARYLVIETDEMADEKFIRNTEKRCYFCKRHLYDEALILAEKKGYECVIEGSNLDDLSDYRPGRQALKEKGVISPLQTAGFTKNDVRILSKKLGLPTHDKPSKACLASRIPYGVKINAVILKKIDVAEQYLESIGFSQVRVRYHGDTARIEILPEEMPAALKKRGDIVKHLSRLGFAYITLDLKGYRTGSMNEVLKKNCAHNPK
jgi:uncharacterized protein